MQRLVKTICAHPDCDEPLKAKGLCSKHHQRWYRTGKTELKSKRPKMKPKDFDNSILPEISVTPKNQSPRGIVRRIDDLGRIVLPKEFDRKFGSLPGLPMEVLVDDEKKKAILRVYNPGCCFCGFVTNLMHYKEKNVCRNCVNELLEGTQHDG